MSVTPPTDKRLVTDAQQAARERFELIEPMANALSAEIRQHWVDVHNEIACNVSAQVKQSIQQLREQNPEDTSFAMADVEHYIKQTATTCMDEVEFWLPQVHEDDSLTSIYFNEINS